MYNKKNWYDSEEVYDNKIIDSDIETPQNDVKLTFVSSRQRINSCGST